MFFSIYKWFIEQDIIITEPPNWQSGLWLFTVLRMEFLG